MMRRRSCLCVLTIPILVILGSTAQLSWAQASPFSRNTQLEWSAPTVTHAGRVRVIITKNKPKIHLARHQRPLVLLSLNDEDTDYYDELPDLQVGYRRPELVNQTAEVEDISDEIKIRLLLARKRALQAYYTKWG